MREMKSMTHEEKLAIIVRSVELQKQGKTEKAKRVRRQALLAPPSPVLRDIIQWDVRLWSRAIWFWEKRVDWNKTYTCLELGGRQGGLSLWLALKGNNVMCSDLSKSKETAVPLHTRYNIHEHVSYEDIDATNIPYTGHFDIVVFKSVLGRIGRGGNKAIQQKTIDEIYRALKPGGKLLFAENLAGSPAHKWLRKKFVPWGDSWRYAALSELSEFLSAFRRVEIKTTGVLGMLGRTEKQRNALAAFDGLLMNYLFPAS